MYSSAPFALLDSFTFFFCINHNLFSVDWVIVAVGKEILIPVGFVGGRSYHGGGIRIDKPAPNRIIVPAAEVVQARFGVIDVPAITQGIHSTQRGGHSAAGGHGRAPGIVGVGHHLGAAGVHKTGDIAQGIFQVEILNAVIRHGRGTQAVVGEVHPVAAPGQVRQGVAQIGVIIRRAVDRLGNAFSVGIVAVGDAAAALAHGRQLAAMLPGIRPRSIGQGIAYGVVGDGLPSERRQQVRPIGIAAAAPGGDEAPPGTRFRD